MNSKRKVQDHHPLTSRSVSFNPDGVFSYKIPVSPRVSLQQVAGQNPLKTNKTRNQIPLQTYISRHQSHLQTQIPTQKHSPLYRQPKQQQNNFCKIYPRGQNNLHILPDRKQNIYTQLSTRSHADTLDMVIRPQPFLQIRHSKTLESLRKSSPRPLNKRGLTNLKAMNSLPLKVRILPHNQVHRPAYLNYPLYHTDMNQGRDRYFNQMNHQTQDWSWRSQRNDDCTINDNFEEHIYEEIGMDIN